MSMPLTIARSLLPTVGRVVHPRRPSGKELATLTKRYGAPKTTTGVVLRAVTQNKFSAPMPLVAEGRFSPLVAEMFMGAFVVEHPQARFLIDAGVCADPKRHLQDLNPIARAAFSGTKPTEGLGTALARFGGRPDFVAITHAHWDHTSGLADFPGIEVRLTGAESKFIDATRGHNHAPVAHSSLQDAVLKPFELDGQPVESFAASHDLFGDGTVLAVDLPGHTPGHVGYLLTLRSGRRMLLAGDAIWSVEQARHLREKAPLLSCMADSNRDETFRSIVRLHAVQKDIELLPAHDLRAVQRVFGGGAVE